MTNADIPLYHGALPAAVASEFRYHTVLSAEIDISDTGPYINESADASLINQVINTHRERFRSRMNMDVESKLKEEGKKAGVDLIADVNVLESYDSCTEYISIGMMRAEAIGYKRISG